MYSEIEYKQDACVQMQIYNDNGEKKNTYTQDEFRAIIS